MSTASLADQLGWCITSKDHLKNLSDAITVAESTLNNTIDVLRQGCPEEVVSLLLPLQAQYQTASKETQKFIADTHISYIEEQSKFIDNKLEQLKQQK